MTIPQKSPIFYKEILDHLYEGVYFVDRERYITYWNQAEAYYRVCCCQGLGQPLL